MVTRNGLRWMMIALVLGALLTASACKRATPKVTAQPTPPADVTQNGTTDPPESAEPQGQRPGETYVMPAGSVDVVYFAYNKSDIRGNQSAALEKNLNYLKANPTVKVLVEGHCDERGTEEYNFALGQRRADAVRDWLLKNGIAPERVATVSRGEANPADPGRSEDAWAKNRRAYFLGMY